MYKLSNGDLKMLRDTVDILKDVGNVDKPVDISVNDSYDTSSVTYTSNKYFIKLSVKDSFEETYNSLTHEMGHIIFDTKKPFKDDDEFWNSHTSDKVIKHVFNMVEDYRINSLLSKAYKGFKKTLENRSESVALSKKNVVEFNERLSDFDDSLMYDISARMLGHEDKVKRDWVNDEFDNVYCGSLKDTIEVTKKICEKLEDEHRSNGTRNFRFNDDVVFSKSYEDENSDFDDAVDDLVDDFLNDSDSLLDADDRGYEDEFNDSEEENDYDKCLRDTFENGITEENNDVTDDMPDMEDFDDYMDRDEVEETLNRMVGVDKIQDDDYSNIRADKGDLVQRVNCDWKNVSDYNRMYGRYDGYGGHIRLRSKLMKMMGKKGFRYDKTGRELDINRYINYKVTNGKTSSKFFKRTNVKTGLNIKIFVDMSASMFGDLDNGLDKYGKIMSTINSIWEVVEHVDGIDMEVYGWTDGGVGYDVMCVEYNNKEEVLSFSPISGSTPINGALRCIANEVHNTRDKTMVLFFTDGRPQSDVQKFDCDINEEIRYVSDKIRSLPNVYFDVLVHGSDYLKDDYMEMFGDCKLFESVDDVVDVMETEVATEMMTALR